MWFLRTAVECFTERRFWGTVEETSDYPVSIPFTIWTRAIALVGLPLWKEMPHLFSWAQGKESNTNGMQMLQCPQMMEALKLA